jgi:hypothetical protein
MINPSPHRQTEQYDNTSIRWLYQYRRINTGDKRHSYMNTQMRRYEDATRITADAQTIRQYCINNRQYLLGVRLGWNSQARLGAEGLGLGIRLVPPRPAPPWTIHHPPQQPRLCARRSHLGRISRREPWGRPVGSGPKQKTKKNARDFVLFLAFSATEKNNK